MLKFPNAAACCVVAAVPISVSGTGDLESPKTPGKPPGIMIFYPFGMNETLQTSGKFTGFPENNSALFGLVI